VGLTVQRFLTAELRVDYLELKRRDVIDWQDADCLFGTVASVATGYETRDGRVALALFDILVDRTLGDLDHHVDPALCASVKSKTLRTLRERLGLHEQPSFLLDPP
jgi:hypothetical protein